MSELEKPRKNKQNCYMCDEDFYDDCLENICNDCYVIERLNEEICCLEDELEEVRDALDVTRDELKEKMQNKYKN